jgi:hypothetical protein
VLHDGTWIEKAPILPYSIFTGKMGIPLSRLHYLQTPLKNPTSPNQNTKTTALSETSSFQFLQENSRGRIGVITQRGLNDEK